MYVCMCVCMRVENRVEKMCKRMRVLDNDKHSHANKDASWARGRGQHTKTSAIEQDDKCAARCVDSSHDLRETHLGRHLQCRVID